ncbi:MAG: TIGR02757 family protein [Phycisphaerae bacterium]
MHKTVLDKNVGKKQLEELYVKYNRREFVHPDPLEFLYGYPEIQDREIVGLIASCLAYGRVFQILKSVKKVLEQIEEPAKFIQKGSQGKFEKVFADFKHRFTTGREMAMLFTGIKNVLEQYGSLNRCFLAGMREKDRTVYEAQTEFSRKLLMGCGRNSLLPLPEGKSACKRLNLYLRWMVRRDQVDIGGWQGISAGKLIVPLDTHMHRISIVMGFTRRKQADARTALEITESFRRFAPRDAVKYDFALTRLGIRKNLD